jgi:hypothetical protein
MLFMTYHMYYVLGVARFLRGKSKVTTVASTNDMVDAERKLELEVPHNCLPPALHLHQNAGAISTTYLGLRCGHILRQRPCAALSTGRFAGR